MKRVKIAQFRYYGDNNLLNFPEDILERVSGKIVCPTSDMLSKYKPILRLNIMTLPGMILYIHYDDKEKYVMKYIVGPTGVLDLDIATLPVSIKGITLDDRSVEILKNNSENYFILTIIYKTEEKEAAED